MKQLPYPRNFHQLTTYGKHTHAVLDEKRRLPPFARAYVYKTNNGSISSRRFKSNSFNFHLQRVSILLERYILHSPFNLHNMTADSSLSILRTVHQPRSVIPTQIESESESEVKSLDRIRTLRSRHLAVRALRIRRNPSESGDDEAQLQIPILRAQYTRISSAQTARTAASTRSNTGSKKEAGQAEDSSRTAT